MGKLLTTFTFDRNTFRRTAEESANSVVKHINLLRDGGDISDKTVSNNITALTNFMGIFKKKGNGYEITELAQVFLDLYSQNREDAWRWLATRSLLRFVVPNGTSSKVNDAAKSLGLSFSLFQRILELLIHLQTQPKEQGFLYYDELCSLLDNDNNWSLQSNEMYSEFLKIRAEIGFKPANMRRGLLYPELEKDYGIPKDNFSALFRKSFAQTGLFQYIYNGSQTQVGIALSPNLDEVLQRRVHFIVDNPIKWDKSVDSTWSDFLALHKIDLPKEVSSTPTLIQDEQIEAVPIDDIVSSAFTCFTDAQFSITEELIRRFIVSLLTKRFLILTGLSGSGKTKIAQMFASWITPRTPNLSNRLSPGMEISSDRTTYLVAASDNIAVEFQTTGNGNEATRVTLPYDLIDEWILCIKAQGFTRETSPRVIREKVNEYTNFSTQLNSFESHLKAAAFALLDNEKESIEDTCYELVSVGADWTSNEHILGYADALNPERYVRTKTLNLILRAINNPNLPFFLILDEMNLSHVERYFADLLSAIESEELIYLHSDRTSSDKLKARDGVYGAIELPRNLFIIGTVNVDETTYMFSPKVLDRANVIEFRVLAKDIKDFLNNPKAIELKKIIGEGRQFGEAFLFKSREIGDLEDTEKNMLKEELSLFFDILASYGAEFGFRNVKEIARFIYFYKKLTNETYNFHRALDAQIIQKLLPKLHGSTKKMEPILLSMAVLCFRRREYEAGELRNRESLLAEAMEVAGMNSNKFDPLAVGSNGIYKLSELDAQYPISYEKIRRMLRLLNQNGFTSFAEA